MSRVNFKKFAIFAEEEIDRFLTEQKTGIKT